MIMRIPCFSCCECLLVALDHVSHIHNLLERRFGISSTYPHSQVSVVILVSLEQCLDQANEETEASLQAGRALR